MATISALHGAGMGDDDEGVPTPSDLQRVQHSYDAFEVRGRRPAREVLSAYFMYIFRTPLLSGWILWPICLGGRRMSRRRRCCPFHTRQVSGAPALRYTVPGVFSTAMPHRCSLAPFGSARSVRAEGARGTW